MLAEYSNGIHRYTVDVTPREAWHFKGDTDPRYLLVQKIGPEPGPVRYMSTENYFSKLREIEAKSGFVTIDDLGLENVKLICSPSPEQIKVLNLLPWEQY